MAASLPLQALINRSRLYTTPILKELQYISSLGGVYKESLDPDKEIHCSIAPVNKIFHNQEMCMEIRVRLFDASYTMSYEDAHENERKSTKIIACFV